MSKYQFKILFIDHIQIVKCNRESLWIFLAKAFILIFHKVRLTITSFVFNLKKHFFWVICQNIQVHVYCNPSPLKTLQIVHVIRNLYGFSLLMHLF